VLQYQDVFQILVNSTHLSQLFCPQDMLQSCQAFQLSYSGFMFVTLSKVPFSHSNFHIITPTHHHITIPSLPHSAPTLAHINELTQHSDFSSFDITIEFIKTMASNQASSPLQHSARHEVPDAAQAQEGKAQFKLAAPEALTFAAATTKAATSHNTRSTAKLATQPGEPPLHNAAASPLRLHLHTRKKTGGNLKLPPVLLGGCSGKANTTADIPTLHQGTYVGA
jgi:hypothetical protein